MTPTVIINHLLRNLPDLISKFILAKNILIIKHFNHFQIELEDIKNTKVILLNKDILETVIKNKGLEIETDKDLVKFISKTDSINKEEKTRLLDYNIKNEDFITITGTKLTEDQKNSIFNLANLFSMKDKKVASAFYDSNYIVAGKSHGFITKLDQDFTALNNIDFNLNLFKIIEPESIDMYLDTTKGVTFYIDSIKPKYTVKYNIPNNSNSRKELIKLKEKANTLEAITINLNVKDLSRIVKELNPEKYLRIISDGENLTFQSKSYTKESTITIPSSGYVKFTLTIENPLEKELERLTKIYKDTIPFSIAKNKKVCFIDLNPFYFCMYEDLNFGA